MPFRTEFGGSFGPRKKYVLSFIAKPFHLCLAPTVLCHGGHGALAFIAGVARCGAVRIGKVGVHPRARRMWVDLDEQLPDHLATQPFARPRELARGLRGTGLASKSDLETKLRVIALGGVIHRNVLWPLS